MDRLPSSLAAALAVVAISAVLTGGQAPHGVPAPGRCEAYASAGFALRA
ncbi:hypothetical protein [Paroceanicella profunda]|nr:hypothetical protein [Paroceanicella profunda]